MANNNSINKDNIKKIVEPMKKLGTIGKGKAYAREPLETSAKRAQSMSQSAAPRTTSADNRNVASLYGRVGGTNR